MLYSREGTRIIISPAQLPPEYFSGLGLRLEIGILLGLDNLDLGMG